MLHGKGLYSSTSMVTVKDANLIPEQQADFIFSVVGEEFGFIGCIIVIAILLLIMLQCVKMARHARNTSGMLIATGIASMICFQSFINIGVATNLLPNTGLPLPFISYGLSSLLSLMIGMGVVLNIGLQKRKY
jgi:rod shape determining protein RodA